MLHRCGGNPWQVRFLSLPLPRVWSSGYDAWLPPKRPGFNSPHPHTLNTREEGLMESRLPWKQELCGFDSRLPDQIYPVTVA